MASTGSGTGGKSDDSTDAIGRPNGANTTGRIVGSRRDTRLGVGIAASTLDDDFILILQPANHRDDPLLRFEYLALADRAEHRDLFAEQVCRAHGEVSEYVLLQLSGSVLQGKWQVFEIDFAKYALH